MTSLSTSAAPAPCCGPKCCASEGVSKSHTPFAEIRTRIATESDREAVSHLLTASTLAGLDASSQFGPQYIVAHDAKGYLLAVAGLEVYGTDALLRSVAVTPRFRSQGLGRQLTQDRLAWAVEHGVSAVYLLTTDASAYWRRHGFSEIRRDEVPLSIRSTSQWCGGCSASAIAMKMQVADAR